MALWIWDRSVLSRLGGFQLITAGLLNAVIHIYLRGTAGLTHILLLTLLADRKQRQTSAHYPAGLSETPPQTAPARLLRISSGRLLVGTAFEE